MRALCTLDEIDEGKAKEFHLADGQRIFVVRKDDCFYGYVNSCPHASLPLNLAPEVFLDLDREYIQCANHMALFDISTGTCVAGPCLNDQLSRLALKKEDGRLWLLSEKP